MKYLITFLILMLTINISTWAGTRNYQILPDRKSSHAKVKIQEGSLPPISPKWVFEPWVWEDNHNTQQMTWDLVTGYLNRDIPTGAVIIDSPWETHYNTFDFDPARYPDAQGLVDSLSARGVHVILWITGCIDPESPNYETARQDTFFIRQIGNDDLAPTTRFWRGSRRASHIDFFNPKAVAWWNSLMDKALDMGVNGWKCDCSDFFVRDLGENVMTYQGIKSKEEYSNAYYRTFYGHTIQKQGAESGMIMARPYAEDCDAPYWYAPADVNTAAWVGDQTHSWEGLREALNEMFISTKAGYAAVGSDIGGYGYGTMEKNLLIRWAQLGAMLPIMENGGAQEHRPWMFGQEAENIYHYFAKLHHELVPYLYSYNIEASRIGISIVRPIGNNKSEWNNDWRYLLGDNIFVAALGHDITSRQITFPDGEWINYWDENQSYQHGQTITYQAPLEQYPIFIRAGAIIPMNVEDDATEHGTTASRGWLTLLAYPKDTSEFVYHKNPNAEIAIESINCPDSLVFNFTDSQENYILRIKKGDLPDNVYLYSYGNLPEKDSLSFSNENYCWYYQSGMELIWVKFSTHGNSASLVINFEGVIPVEFVSFAAKYDGNQVTLCWSTITESNNFGFHIHRKSDLAQDWQSIGFVPGKGTTVLPQTYVFVDADAITGTRYYRLQQQDLDGQIHLSQTIQINLLPIRFALQQNNPNPFNPVTLIKYQIPDLTLVTIDVFNIMGQHIRTLVDGEKSPGSYQIMWNGLDEQGQAVSSGVYLYKMQAGDFTAMKKMVLVR